MTKQVPRPTEDWNKLGPPIVAGRRELFRDDGRAAGRSERRQAGDRLRGRAGATDTRTGRGRRRKGSGSLLLAWLLPLAGLFAGSAQADVLLSNLNKSNDSGLSTGGTAGNTRFTHAIRFTTGSNEDGYTLSSVKAVLENASNPDGVRVQIYSESSGLPDSSLYTLVNPTIANGTNTFTAPAGSSLEKSTKYFVVFDSTATGGQYNVRATNSNTLTSMATGWTLNTDRHTKSTSNTNWTTHAAVPRVEINGTADTAATEVAANWDLIPSGLSADDQFRLIFVSSTRRDGTSSTIGDYDTHVQTAAASGHDAIQSYSSQFKALGCTATTDARDHTETTYTATDKGVAIYWLDGEKAADDYEDFYDGTWDSNFPKDEDGNDGSTAAGFAGGVYTGCESDGTADSGNTLGTASPVSGRPGHDGLEIKNVNTAQANNRKVYGLSGVFQVSDLSPDATLTDLDLTWNDGGTATDITLFPTFLTTTTNYGARVATSVSRITIAPTLGDSNAGVDYLDDSDQTLSDADSDPATGFQVDLSTGANTIKVKVTAEDTINIETYTVTVIRAAQASGSEIWSGVLTVGHLGGVDDQATGYCDTASGRCTGDAYGALSDDDFNLDGTAFTVESLRWSGDDNTDKLHLTLDADIPAASLPGLVLRVGANDFPLADAGRGNKDNDVQNNYHWTPFSTDILKLEAGDTIAVKLFEAAAPTADANAVNADLDDLEFSWDDSGTATAIALSPEFDSAVGTYAGSVGSTVSDHHPSHQAHQRHWARLLRRRWRPAHRRRFRHDEWLPG
ncbi:MAG: cadherin-like beta sandwich domain-containing protein [Gammaproteobacteria bacterium]|nr:cadherin-like beta sandwich domain-containing protein [Gammaproteobacteria bacterium]